MDPGVHALQYLDVINMKDSEHRANFYYSLKGVLPAIPKVCYNAVHIRLITLSTCPSDSRKNLFARKA